MAKKSPLTDEVSGDYNDVSLIILDSFTRLDYHSTRGLRLHAGRDY